MEITYTLRKQPEYKVKANEVIRILDNRPHLLVRMEISGEYFPHRAAHPFVHIKKGSSAYVHEYFAEISPDNQAIVGYMPVDLPEEGIIEFGYGDEIWGSITKQITSTTIARLNPKKLPEKIVIVDQEFVKQRRNYGK